MKYPIKIAAIFTLLYFIMHLLLMNDYGLSWDFHYHHYAGLYHMGLPVPSINDPAPVPFTPPDPRLTIEDPFGPFTQIVPSFFEYILHEKLHILPIDDAYNFPIIVVGSLGIFLLFLFLYEAIGVYEAYAGMIALAFLPVSFGYLHTDMKDVPNAFAFTLAVYTFWRLVVKPDWKRFLIAVILFAIAFNIKINSVVAPVVCGVWFAIVFVLNIKIKKLITHYALPITYFITAPIIAVLLWIPFWKHPFQKLLELPHFYSNNTINMPVLYLGEIVRSGVNISRLYPYVYIAVTTPLVILIPFLIGLIYIITNIFINIKKPPTTYNSSSLSLRAEGLQSTTHILLLCWFFIPLARYMNPTSGAIDGVRHFFEIVYPLCALAGIGTIIIWKNLRKVKYGRQVSLGIGILSICSLIYIAVHFHPYQTSYFNSLIGGISGAQGNLDIDFWGTPQKKAMLWLNEHASAGATVNVVMAQSSAGVYARPDLVKTMNTKSFVESDYLVILNRQSFYQIYPVEDLLKQRIAQGKVAYTVSIDKVPLVWVLRK
jgi:hypothetical protein